MIRKLCAAVAAALLIGASSAAAATAVRTYSIVGSAKNLPDGTLFGDFTLEFDDLGVARMIQLNLTVGSRRFTEATAAFEYLARYQAGSIGLPNAGVTSVGAPGIDDFYFNFGLFNPRNNDFHYTGLDYCPTTYCSGPVDIRVTSAPVPEPATWALMLSGIAGLGWALRRRDRAVAASRA